MRNVVNLWFLYFFFLSALITGCAQEELAVEVDSGKFSANKDPEVLLKDKSKPRVDPETQQQSKSIEQQEAEKEKQREGVEEETPTPKTSEDTEQKEQPTPSDLPTPFPMTRGTNALPMGTLNPPRGVTKAEIPSTKGLPPLPVPANLPPPPDTSMLPPPPDISMLPPPPPIQD